MTISANQGSSVKPLRCCCAFLLLFLVAAALLMLFLGKGSLAPVEGGSANAARLFSAGDLPPGAGPRFLSHALLMRQTIRVAGLSEFSVRLPSVIAALFLLAGTVTLALRYLGKQGSLLTGWMLLGSYGFLYWGRSAAGAIFPAALVVWAAAIGNWQRESYSFLRSFGAGLLLFSALFFFNNLAFLFILFLWLPELFSRSVWRKKRKWAGTTGFFLAFLLVLTAAFTLISAYGGGYEMESWRIILREASRQVAKWLRVQSSEFSLSMLTHLPRLLLPWPLLTLAAVLELIRHRERVNPSIFRLSISLILMFLCAGIWPMRRWGAILPLLPFALIVTAAGLDPRIGVRLPLIAAKKIMSVLLMVTASLVTVFPVSWPLWKMLLRQEPPVYVMLAFPLFGLLALGILNGEYLPRCHALWQKILPSRYAGIVLAGVIVMGALLCILQPGLTPFRTGKRFWSAVRETKEKNEVEKILFFRNVPGASSLFYLNSAVAIPVMENAGELEALFRNTREKKMLIVTKRSGENGTALQKAARANGWECALTCDVAEDAPLQFFHRGAPGEYDASDLFGAWILKRQTNFP